MAVCAVPSIMATDERFQQAKSHYTQLGWSNAAFADAIVGCRERYGYDANWFPVEPSQRSVFTRYIRSKYESDKLAATVSTTESDNLVDLYDKIYGTFTPQILEARLQLMRMLFDNVVDLYAKQRPEWTRQEVIQKAAKEGMSSYERIMKRAYDIVQKKWTTADHWYERKIAAAEQKEGTLSEERKAQIRKESEYAAVEYQKVLDNWEVLKALAAPRIGEANGFSISVKDFGMTSTLSEESEDTSTSDETQDADGSNIQDTDEGSKGDRYGDFRLAKILDTLSPKARRFLNRIPKIDEKGNVILDDLGNPTGIGARQAMIVLKRVLTNATPATMMECLEDWSTQYRWLAKFAEMLDEEPDMRAVIYAAAKGSETTFVYTNLEDGKYQPRIANTKAADLALMREAGNNAVRGTVLVTEGSENYSLYNSDGSLKSRKECGEIHGKFGKFVRELLSPFRYWATIEGEPPYRALRKHTVEAIETHKEQNLRDVSFLLDYLDKPADGIREYFNRNRDHAEKLTDFLRGMGFDVTVDNVIDGVSRMMTKKGFSYFSGQEYNALGIIASYKNLLSILVNNMGELYACAETASAKDKNGSATGQYLYNLASLYYKRITYVLGVAKCNELEARVVNEGKSLTTHSHTNLLHQTIDDLTNAQKMSEEEYEQMLEHDFLRYEGMSLGSGANRKVLGWLQFLRGTIRNSDGFIKYPEDVLPGRSIDLKGTDRSMFKLIDIAAFNHVEYSKLSKEQKLTNQIIQFFQGGKMLYKTVEWGLYEVPIQADYGTAFNYISAPIYSYGVGYDEAYAKRLSADKAKLEAEYNQAIKDAIERGEFTEDIYQATEFWDYSGKERIPAESSPMRIYWDAYQEKLKALEEDFRAKDAAEDSKVLEQIRIVDGDVYVSDLVRRISDEVLAEMERIASIERRRSKPDYMSLGVRDDRGLLFHIFPEFNDNGFREKYNSFTNPKEAQDFLWTQVAEQMEKALQHDIAFIEKSGALSNPAMKYVGGGDRISDGNIFSEDGSYEKLTDMGKIYIRGFILNNFYARLQMCKIFNGGLENFKGLLDYEKRNMMLHSPHSSLFEYATWNGELVGKTHQNVMILEDDCSASAFLSDIQEMLQQLRDEKIISEQQFKYMLASYNNITTTDGQGFRTLDSYKEIQVMAGNWDAAHERAYKRIKSGHPQYEDINVFMQNIKPVYTGFEPVEFADQSEKPVKMTVLHKYSEQVLLPMALAEYCLQAKSTPVMAMAKAAEQLKKDGKPVDLFIFHSGVKVGAFGVIDPLRKVNGQRVNATCDSIANEIVSAGSITGVIHTLPYKGYGIVASTPAHVADDKISWAVQAETVAMANIEDGDTVTVRGETRNAKEMREVRNDMRTADIIEAYKKLRDIFSNGDELEKMFQDELASKSYNSREMQFALTRLKDGTFALPLFSPNVAHQVQQLLASVIKKRLTKPKLKGANILQATGLGMDAEVSSFVPTRLGELFNEDKLGIRFEGKGKNKHIKYIEAYLPLIDSRLKQFADLDGNIGPSRLQKLIDLGVIPESMLEFVAYRTPSDAEHSVLPCRIKGFMANTAGATIIMPKEAMVLTGCDYDGDKMRCHFKNFNVVNRDGIEDTEENRHRPAMETKKCVVEEYDYTKSALENSAEARANGRVELMFAQLTSPAGSRRVLIPGGSMDTQIVAKSMFLVRASKDAQSVQAMKSTMRNELKMSDEAIKSMFASTSSLYEGLIRMPVKNLSKLAAAVSGYTTPFSVMHATEAFEYMMGGAEMIGIYAMYNAAFQRFQRLNIHYNKKSSSGKDTPITIFGHTFDKLFSVRNRNGRLASLSFARLLNAAVDNGKDPILGYLNQTPQAAELTFFLLANGLTEEDVHLIMCQPAVVEIFNRMKRHGAGSFTTEARAVIGELAGELPDSAKQKANVFNTGGDKLDGRHVARRIVATMERKEFTKGLADGFSDLGTYAEGDARCLTQAAIVQFLVLLNKDAQLLADFAKIMRPESDSGAIGTDTAEIVAQIGNLNEIRNEIKNNVNFTGLSEVVSSRAVSQYAENGNIRELLGAQLPEVVALNTLMIEEGLDMFRPYFPIAKTDWAEFACQMASMYSLSKLNAALIRKIGNEMILWKLLSNKQFIHGDSQEEQKRILVDVPKNFRDLMERIDKAHQNPGTDTAAEELYGNLFLNKMICTSPEEEKLPRLMFMLNGTPAEGTTDLIRAHWHSLITSKDSSIRQFGLDLFKYTIYTSGFGYGMYEFAHYAPFSVLMDVHGYTEALKSVLRSSWTDAEKENFMHQYFMNHWGDTNLLRRVNFSSLHSPIVKEGIITLTNKADLDTETYTLPYVVVVSKTKSGKRQEDLYRIVGGGSEVRLEPAQKLGKVSRRKQVTLQYNPGIDYHLVKPVVPGNDSAWGDLSDVSSARATRSDGITDTDGSSTTAAPRPTPSLESMIAGKPVVISRVKAGEQVAAKPATANVEVVQTETPIQQAETSANAGAQNSMPNLGTIKIGGLEFTPTGSLADAIVGTGIEGEENTNSSSETESTKVSDGKFLSIAQYDEEVGTYRLQKVPATPNNVREARRQRTFVRLNERLKTILENHGVAVGTLYEAEARMAIGGIADFDTATVTAEGLLELIRLSNGYEGEAALPEEFAHVALEMLGHDHPLVSRLLNALRSSDEALEEAYEGMYGEYLKRYGEDAKEKLVVEAAGKLVSKYLLREQEIETSFIRRLVHRICDAIKSFFRKFSRDEMQNAIFDANDIASKIAREMLGGRLADDMSLDNIGSGKYFKTIQQDLTGKQDILSKLRKIETKRLAILKKRIGYKNKDQVSEAQQATEQQIAQLEHSILDHKSEEAVLMYLQNSLEFLANTEQSLDDAVNSGRPLNSVCKKLNTVRDTIYSFAAATRDIREAINDGEISDSNNLIETLNTVSGVIARFRDKYDTLARTYFEEMLSGVYGEHGITKTVGSEKGRTISIHEMATRADRDISLASRWFNSLADCNDYVLKAVDDVVRNAKIRARKKAALIRPQIEVAVADLIRETGSRDQSFMFEYKRNEDTGKMERTGKYISLDDSKKLSAPQKKFYDAMMKIKAEADACLPSSLVEDDHLKIVMLRKYTLDKVRSVEGMAGKGLAIWEGVKESVMDMSDNFDPEHHEVAVDFEGNKVDMLPVKFVFKGKKESYDDMTDDVAMSMMTYAGMAHEYRELNGVVDIIENAKYMAAERDVVQKTGNRTQQETINSDTVSFTEPFTKKAARLNAQKALNDFISMHLYGHLAANEGTFGKTRISKRKVVDAVNHLVSLSQMALNLSQRIANVSAGGAQVLIESAGKGVYNAKDVSWATAVYTKESADRMAQTGKTDYDNKLSLWMEYFDIHQENGRNSKHYKKGRMSRIFNENLLYAGLTIGEDYLSAITSLAAARNFKVKDASGKTVNLWDAYEVRYKDAAHKTGAYLALKEGYTKEDGSAITAEDEAKFAKQVISLNFDMQGIYNTDDKSAIQQYSLGALMIMYRKWIAPAIKRRYGPTQYSTLKGTEEEGYYRTLARTLVKSFVDAKDAVTEEQGTKALLRIGSDISAFVSAVKLNWSNLSDYEKSNCMKAFTELGTVLGLFLATSLLLRLPPDDHDGNEILCWLDSMVMSQLLRLRSELGAQAPTPMFVGEAFRILKSPFAAVGPIKDTLNIFQLMLPHNYMIEIKSGRYKGHVKAYKYFREFPIISMYKKIENFVDPTPVLQYYKNDSIAEL